MVRLGTRMVHTGDILKSSDRDPFVDAKFYDKSLDGLEYFEKTVAPRSAHNALSAGMAESGIYNSSAAKNLIKVLTQSLSIEPANRPSLPVLVNAIRIMENQLNVADHTRHQWVDRT